MTHDPDTVELLPCPFCNANGQTWSHVRDGRTLGCSKCGTRFTQFNGPRDNTAEMRLVKLWNTRPEPNARLRNLGKASLGVKPLEWVTPSPTTDGQWQDTTGFYDIEEGILFIGHVETGIRCGSVAEAKAKADEHHRAHVLSALTKGDTE